MSNIINTVIPLGVHTHTLDFMIQDADTCLVFTDLSDYMEAPECPEIEVTFPGYRDYVSVPIRINEVNKIAGSLLGLTNCGGNIPDGLYTIKYQIAPKELFSKTKYHLRTAELQKQKMQMLDQLDFCDVTGKENRDLTTKLMSIELYLDGAEVALKKCDDKLAMKLYKAARELTNSINCSNA